MTDRAEAGARTAVEVRDVVKVFGRGAEAFRAVDNVSVSIRENEFFTLLGPSGCGKTTLLRLIAGFEHPSAGSILLDGRDISADPPYKRPVNTVFQSYALFPHLTVAQNIAFGLEMLGRPRDAVKRTVAEMLALVRMEALADRRTSEISGGQQQRVALARALAPRPRVLLLDEPLSALDFKLRKEMQTELKRLQSETGITFIFVTHDQEEALTMSDRVAVMSSGVILQVGAPREVYEHPATRFVADFIGDTNFLAAEAAGGRLRLAAGADLARPSGGRDGRVTVAIRPEHVRLTGPGEGMLDADVIRSVYFGTDTHVHLHLTGGEPLVARIQNAGAPPPSPGAQVGVRFAEGAVQVLAD